MPRKLRPKRPLRPLVFLGLAAAAFLVTCAAEAWLGHSRVAVARIGVPGFAVSTLLALAGSISGLVNLWRGQNVMRGPLGALLNFAFGLLGLAMAALGAFTTLWATVGFARGRQLRRFGRALLPPVAGGVDWVDETLELDGEAQAPPGVGEQWRENGRTEHASVASFARLTLDLMALGAPPALVTSANQDALDEIVAILKQIAADEGRHAAHGWDVVDWCLEQGGLPVAHALSGAVRVLPARMRSSLPERAVNGEWQAWGIHGAALERDEYAAARADVVQRVGRLLTAANAGTSETATIPG